MGCMMRLSPGREGTLADTRCMGGSFTTVVT
jgi:hypothetical protein